MNINYTATDAQLLAAGMDEKTMQLSKQEFLRPGARDVDLVYLNAVWAAKEMRDLHALAVNNPTAKHITYPPGAKRSSCGYMRGDV